MRNNALNYECFRRSVDGLLHREEVRRMQSIRHHPGTTCYEHSVFVSYVAFRLARRMGWDYRAAARGGLLHDLYLYDPRDRSAHPGVQCFDHPQFALKNARALCPDLSELEENIIVSHMWPLAKEMPHSKEALAVNLADKLCAAADVCRVTRLMRMARKLSVPA